MDQMFIKAHPRNKLRLYLAYDARQATPRQAEKYHTSLILSAKKPKNKPGLQDSTIYNATNPIDPSTGKQIWKYEIKPSEPRRIMLAGLMLLGKVPPNMTKDTIAEILRAVPVKQDPDWWCQNWIWDAMQVLVEEGVITKLPDTPEEVWKAGRSFVNGESNGIPNHKVWVPTCDTTGKKIDSEIPPLSV